MVTVNATTPPYNMTQLWLADEDRFYVFANGGCSYSSLGGLGMLRPDAFEHALRTDPDDSKYVGRELVDGQWCDHFTVGPAGASQFNMWMSIETNFPVVDYGPANFGGEIGINHWKTLRVGQVPDAMFRMDTSQCKPSSGVHVQRPSPPLLRRQPTCGEPRLPACNRASTTHEPPLSPSPSASASASASGGMPTTAGAPLWVEWVTAGQRVSTWDNTAQVSPHQNSHTYQSSRWCWRKSQRSSPAP